MTVDIPYELPENWVWTSLADIADIIMGSSPPSSSYNKEKAGLPFYQGKTDFGFLSPTPRVWCSSPYKVAEEGDVLISVRAPVGPTNLCTEKSCIGRGLGAIRPRAGIPSLFVLFYLRSIEKNVAQMGTGSTFTAIKRSDLESLPFPLASLNEQKRIVAKIESLFAESKTTLDALGKLPVFLRRFRQSVLAKAFRGELTQRESDDEP
ncbi:MAG: restriction endonuclease subunit S, partial [Crenarchaeota archaeon]|nr:restriction endonuclease subunit S [Thermoproteota archaeon]